MAREQKVVRQTVQVNFEMAETDGTEKLRTVARHAHRVGQAWIDCGFAFERFADSLDELTTTEEVDE